jgi:hypothetical protein
VGAHATSTLPPPASHPTRHIANPANALATAAQAKAPARNGFTVVQPSGLHMMTSGTTRCELLRHPYLARRDRGRRCAGSDRV